MPDLTDVYNTIPEAPEVGVGQVLEAVRASEGGERQSQGEDVRVMRSENLLETNQPYQLRLEFMEVYGENPRKIVMLDLMMSGNVESVGEIETILNRMRKHHDILKKFSPDGTSLALKYSETTEGRLDLKTFSNPLALYKVSCGLISFFRDNSYKLILVSSDTKKEYEIIGKIKDFFRLADMKLSILTVRQDTTIDSMIQDLTTTNSYEL